MEKGNFVYSGWRANGFVALVGLLVLIAGGIALCVFGSDVMDPRIGLRTAMLVCGVCLFFISMFCFKGFMLLEPNEARVVMFFGKYKGTFYETGFWWINPFMGRKKISVRARNLNVEPIKVNDKNGNPVMIGLVLVWKICPDEIYRAVFEHRRLDDGRHRSCGFGFGPYEGARKFRQRAERCRAASGGGVLCV